MQNKDYNEELKKSGLKSTKQRAAILEILKKSERPITAEQVYIELKEKNIPANLSTIYRNFAYLCEKELVNKLAMTGENSTLYEINRLVHRHYLVCLGCKKVLAIEDCPLQRYEELLAEETNFVITGHKLDIYGYCAECQKKGCLPAEE
ncbi:MAG: transcriptional repressor [Negativicutes bacterium]|nr:transcriptional repressor [Negativicutes bacterium]